MRRNDGESLWSGEKTDEATKGDEDAKLRWLDCLTSEVPQSVGVALVVEMNPSLFRQSNKQSKEGAQDAPAPDALSMAR